MKKQDFAYFQKCVVKYIELLGVKDFYISVEQDELDEDRAGQCSYDTQNRWALITVDKNIENVSRKAIESVAKHEVLELVLADIRVALDDFYNPLIVDKHIHRVIRRLENALK